MQNTIYACIWCDNNASEMANYYADIFPNTKITEQNPVVVMLEMEGQKIMLLNGGDMFKPNPAASLMALCKTEEEVETLYNKMIGEGEALMPLGVYPFSKKYGWLKDKFDVNWQFYFGSDGGAKEKYVPTLMFIGDNNGKAEEAIAFYTSVFPNAHTQGIMRYSEEDEDTTGHVKHAQFDIEGFTLMCMDSSWDHGFQFNESFSLVVNCKNQEEIDRYWNTLTANGGAESQCGWLKDKYGFSWQIVPKNINELLSKGTPEQNAKAMNALMGMKKIVIEELVHG